MLESMRIHTEIDRTPSKPAVTTPEPPSGSAFRQTPTRRVQPSQSPIIGSGTLKRPRPQYSNTRSLSAVSSSPSSASKRSVEFASVIDSQITRIRSDNQSPSKASSTKPSIPAVITISDDDSDAINVPDSDSDSDTDSDVESYFPNRDHFSDSGSSSLSSLGSQPCAARGIFSPSKGNSRTIPSSSNSASQRISPTSSQRITPPLSPSKAKRVSLSRQPSSTRTAASGRFSRPASKPDVFTEPAPIPEQPKPAPESLPKEVPHALDDAAIIHFLQQPLGTDLEHYTIAHNRELQALFDELRIEWGVQYQVARGECSGLWTWEQVVAKVERLQGTNEEVGPNVAAIINPEKGGSGTDPKVWPELDREQAAILENKGRMFGLMGEWKGAPNWHGGQIQQLARLVEKSGTLKIVLEPLEKRRSHRFARFAGSRRILQLRIPDSLLQSIPDKVKGFLAQRFILLGRTFVPFHCKDGSVYMVETDQNWERQPQEWCGDQHRQSFIQFMEWHNPMALNARQAISKFVTRYALGLSNSVPVIEFEKKNLIFIDDVYASDWPVGNPKAPTEKIMTDGCGYINLAALTIITRRMGYESAPTALQGRIDGAKGLWMRHPSDDSEEPRIWIRDSQNKIKNPVLDRGHRIFELVAPSKASTNINLSMQSILNLFENGVPEEVIVTLFREGLKDEVSPLLQWDSIVLLYDAVSKAGGVSSARLVRVAAGASVAMGLQRSQWGHDDVDSQEDEAKDELQPLTYTGRNPYSGAPHNLHENLLEMIQAGFHPRDCKIVQEKLKQVITTAVTSAVEKYRIPLKDSISAWLVPDPYAEVLFPQNRGRSDSPGIRDPLGLLKEGEVYFRSSQPLKDQDSELAYHVITGDVVLGRYPMRLPSDLQKVTAVDKPEYALYTDVLIVSVNGTSSLPSFLSGGDMDGDIVNIFRDPDLVRHFINKPLTEPPSDLLEANFQKDVVSVQSFCSRAAEKSPAEAQKWYQEFLLANVVSEQKGLYSMFHDSSIATLGYSDPQTIRLAYIFNALLDASKTGLRLKDGIFDDDKAKYGKKPEPFGILARLKAEGITIEKELMEMFSEAVKADPAARDPEKLKDLDLIKPYSDAVELARSFYELSKSGNPATADQGHEVVFKLLQREITLIKNHVEAAKAIFDKEFGRKKAEDNHNFLFASPTKGGAKGKKPASRGTPKNDQDDLMLQAAKKYSEPIEGLQVYRSNVEELKASCAYYLVQNPTVRFPWTVAFRELCLMKAKAQGMAPMIREIDESKTVSSSVVKVLAKKTDMSVF